MIDHDFLPITIAKVPLDLKDDSIKAYPGVNLFDSNQRDQLFRVLRRNMYVIDYWLSEVFKHEAKVFAHRLM